MEKLNLSTMIGASGRLYDPATHARVKADTVNQLCGDLTGWDCPKCLNKGYIARPREDGSVFTQECDCMVKRRCIWKMEESGLKNIIRDCTFEKFVAKESWQTAIKQGAMTYADNPDGWLLICGQSGSGKTHLCTAICRERLLAGDEVRYMPWRDDIAKLKAASLDSEKRERMLQELKTAQILYIDDLYKTGKAADGSSNPTSADVSLAFEIINYRYINQLPTILSTEKTPEELVVIDEATAGRVIQMAQGNVYTIDRDVRRNYRLRGVVLV